MREIELKSVVHDLHECLRRIEAAGGRHVFVGRLEDRRYDTRAQSLAAEDIVLRIRTYRTAAATTSHLDWKGPTERVDGFKVREELTTLIGDPVTLATMLRNLGYTVVRSIDREIIQYSLNDTMIRFEQYPKMDTLVEVEGTPERIEAAISVLDLPREGFTTGRLTDFVRAYEARTGERASVADRPDILPEP